MAEPDDDDPDDAPPPEDEIRAALLSLRSGDAEVGDVITLWNAAPYYEQMLPQAAFDAIMATMEIKRDVFNGGMDQVVWNHGATASRIYARFFRTIGMIENADLLDRLCDVLEAQEATRTHEEAAADPIKHFFAFRTAVKGPGFGVPDPQTELTEPVLEYVIAHASELPDPESALVRRPDAPVDTDED